jgi:hypothetical protein
MTEVIFVRLATHLRFYVGTLDCQFKYDSSKVKINEIVIIYFSNLNLESESTDNSLTNDLTRRTKSSRVPTH